MYKVRSTIILKSFPKYAHINRHKIIICVVSKNAYKKVGHELIRLSRK